MWVDGESYGVDGEGPVPDTDEHSDNCIVVIPPNVPVTSDILNNLPNPLSDDGNFGISLYLSVLDIIQ